MDELTAILSQFDLPRSVIDIALVTAIFYGVLRLFAGTQGVQLLRGVLVIILVGALLMLGATSALHSFFGYGVLVSEGGTYMIGSELHETQDHWRSNWHFCHWTLMIPYSLLSFFILDAVRFYESDADD